MQTTGEGSEQELSAPAISSSQQCSNQDLYAHWQSITPYPPPATEAKIRALELDEQLYDGAVCRAYERLDSQPLSSEQCAIQEECDHVARRELIVAILKVFSEDGIRSDLQEQDLEELSMMIARDVRGFVSWKVPTPPSLPISKTAEVTIVLFKITPIDQGIGFALQQLQRVECRRRRLNWHHISSCLTTDQPLVWLPSDVDRNVYIIDNDNHIDDMKKDERVVILCVSYNGSIQETMSICRALHMRKYMAPLLKVAGAR